MIGLLIGCARVSTQEQDLIATATSMIKSAAGAASYLISHANTRVAQGTYASLGNAGPGAAGGG